MIDDISLGASEGIVAEDVFQDLDGSLHWRIIKHTMTDFISIYCTYPDRAAAETISRVLLDQRLVACANFVEGKSLYWWQDKIEQASEVFVLYKTTREKFA